jgi:DNA polymerase III delta prime subunit
MSDIKNYLLWEKWRPKKIEDIIILPRIRKYFQNGLNGNYILYGPFGSGKTSLARILIGKYTKDKPFLEINSSMATSIEVLRNEIEDFCKFSPMISSDSDYKYIFLDEFERVSLQFQDAFKAFIEKYNKNVRFIITTNHINKISEGIRSRIPQINFDCQDTEEEKYLKVEIFKRINNTILPAEGKTIPKEQIITIINKKFPDFRSIIIGIQNYIETGDVDINSSTSTNKIKLDLYNVLYDKSLDYEKIYHFIMSNFGPEKVDILIKLLGKSFIDWSINEKKSNIEKLFHCNYIIADYSSKLETSTDPVILAMTIIGKFRDILN